MASAIVVAERLRRDTKHGKPLEGLEFDETYQFRVDAPDTLPVLHLVGIRDTSSIFGNAPANSSNMNTGQMMELALAFELRTRAELGWLPSTRKSDDWNTWSASDWMCEIRDSIERGDDGVSDAGLSLTSLKPVKIEVVEFAATQTTLTLGFVVTTTQRGFCRAGRSLTYREVMTGAGITL